MNFEVLLNRNVQIFLKKDLRKYESLPNFRLHRFLYRGGLGSLHQITYLKMFSIQLLCLKSALTIGVPEGTSGALRR